MKKLKNFKPFSQMKKELLANPKISKHYDELESEYELIRSVIDKRLQRKMSQAELAKKVGTGQSAISRLESGEYNPSMKFLQKIARALEARLTISFH